MNATLKPEQYVMTVPDGMTWRNPREAFDLAISQGRLSVEPHAYNAAGAFMYMGTNADGIDLFKSIVTRQYLPTLPQPPKPEPRPFMLGMVIETRLYDTRNGARFEKVLFKRPNMPNTTAYATILRDMDTGACCSGHYDMNLENALRIYRDAR